MFNDLKIWPCLVLYFEVNHSGPRNHQRDQSDNRIELDSGLLLLNFVRELRENDQNESFGSNGENCDAGRKEKSLIYL